MHRTRSICTEMTETNMNYQKWLQQALGLMLIMFFLVACGIQPPTTGFEASEATATPISPTAAAPTAKATSAPISPTAAAPTAEAPLKVTVTATPLVAMTGTFDANGRSLYIECRGTGSPTIVLEPGEGAGGLAMYQLQKRLAARTTSCVYDRANNGRSSNASVPRTAQDVVDDLHALLAAAKVPGPYVLVGQSAGGLFVQLYARTFPDQVVGVVAMNPVPPAHPWLDEVRRVFTEQERAEEQAYYGGQNGESLQYLASSEQLAAAAKPPAVPFEMLVSTNAQCEEPNGPCMKSYSIYERIMRDVTAVWPRGTFSQVAAGHEIFHDDIDVVMATVERVLASP
jgi:pimeloyl-ACP methyl ester carboxylesterase